MKQIHKIVDNDINIIIEAAQMFCIGIFLLNADSAFQYPPSIRGLIDNDNLDTFFIAVAFLLLFCVFLPNTPQFIRSVTYGITTGLLVFLAFEVGLHAYMMNLPLLGVGVIFIIFNLIGFIYSIYK